MDPEVTDVVIGVAVGRIRPCRGGDELGEEEDPCCGDEDRAGGAALDYPMRLRGKRFRLCGVQGFLSLEAGAGVDVLGHGRGPFRCRCWRWRQGRWRFAR